MDSDEFGAFGAAGPSDVVAICGRKYRHDPREFIAKTLVTSLNWSVWLEFNLNIVK